MCYSLRTSLFAYSCGLCAAIVALYTKQYALGMLILFYCHIQLAEAFIWYGIDNANVAYNRFGTNLAKFTLPLHMFGLCIGIMMSMDTPKEHLFIPLIGLVFYFVVILIIYPLTDRTSNTSLPADKCLERSCQNLYNRLQWPFKFWWYAISVVMMFTLIFYYVRPIQSAVFITCFLVGTCLFSITLNRKSMGTIWCFASAIAAPLLVLGNYIILHYGKNHHDGRSP